MDTKTCTECGETKALDDFPLGRGRFGRRSKCNECKRIDAKRYRERNAVAIRERRHANKDVAYAKAREYAKAHKFEIAAQKHKRYCETKDNVLLRIRSWQEKNKERVFGYKRKCELNHRDEYRKSRKHRSKNDTRNCYIRMLLIRRTALMRPQIPGELVTAKRQQLKIHRAAKKLNNSIKEKSDAR